MAKHIRVDTDAAADGQSEGGLHELTHDLAYQRLIMVNVAYLGTTSHHNPEWVLVDAGLPGSTKPILESVEHRFGKGARPAAIILTHGHFDHVGVLKDLAEQWDVPIYAHEREHPYLDGTSEYPPPDPKVGGGMMAALSRFYPRGPIDVSRWLQVLPPDGTIPALPDWQWVHTPGHSRGHVSLWRATDRTLVVGDAFITTDQESAYAVATQKTELQGPPMYFTPDWEAARDSVRHLASLEPELVITGHGRALQGAEMRHALHTLARDFDGIAVPNEGRYVTND